MTDETVAKAKSSMRKGGSINMLLHELSPARFFDSFRELERMQSRLNRLFEYSRASVVEFPPVNVWTSEDEALLTAEIPGIAAEDIDISIVNATLTLRGKREAEPVQEGQTLHRNERGFGQFARTISLPFRVDQDKVEANFKNGVLSIRLPRAEADKPRKISVST
jgi:HSP20 family protein